MIQGCKCEICDTIKIPLTVPLYDLNGQVSAQSFNCGCAGTDQGIIICDLHRGVSVDGQTLKTGIKKDEGKARYELIAWEVIDAVARILTEGAKKYNSRNWERGIQFGRVYSGVLRHLTSWFNSHLTGSDGINHADGNESHLDHAITGLMFLSAYEKREMTQFDDRPTKTPIQDLRQG